MALNPNKKIVTNGVPVNGIQHMKNAEVNVYTANVTLDADNSAVYCNTDGGDFTVTLPALDEYTFRIINTGTGILTIAPDGTDLLVGLNESVTMAKGVVILTGETTEGWW